jgi:hypothetical protein
MRWPFSWHEVRFTCCSTSSALPSSRSIGRRRADQNLAAALEHEGLASIHAARIYARLTVRAAARTLAERAARWETHREEASRLLAGLGP